MSNEGALAPAIVAGLWAVHGAVLFQREPWFVYLVGPGLVGLGWTIASWTWPISAVALGSVVVVLGGSLALSIARGRTVVHDPARPARAFALLLGGVVPILLVGVVADLLYCGSPPC